ncbi:MAG: 5-amino-6-(D-ribitylamino)uracil--L-tyrosine 4-hydroxyphenyl transferase CofH [Candidatus Hadarchaeum sp.]|jgi:7,8-didemethyl-8-hydroxy-5-deazariboflavin synthase CofH subunit|nr:5-amino-6-(D-ribitylamino)uracil--L-tyrosine 4-hydroxyphenyl transferase CofH [Candidatus Hadarchaeum sp.]
MFDKLFDSLDPKFCGIIEKALEGKEITVEECERLLHAEGRGLHALVLVADEVRRQRVGDVVTYVVNRNINYSNICVGDCKFCAFKRNRGDKGAYTLTLEQISDKTKEALNFGATEICMQGGLNPELTLENYVAMLKAIRNVSADIHIHAFSPAELNFIARRSGLSLKEVVETLLAAGLNSVPGTAAEILADRVRDIICPGKISSSEWQTTIKLCHRLGLPSTATMMYGHVETPREQAEHMALVREIQRETHGFTEFVLLPFMHEKTPLQRAGIVRDGSSGVDNIRVHAVARLMLAGYIDNIQTSWVKLGPKVAQMMLNVGANDLGGTLLEENISRAAGARIQMMAPRELERLIKEIGRIPRQRTTTYGTPQMGDSLMSARGSCRIARASLTRAA